MVVSAGNEARGTRRQLIIKKGLAEWLDYGYCGWYVQEREEGIEAS